MTEQREYTGDELDAIEQLLKSEGYRLLRERVELELERWRGQIEQLQDISTTNLTRGRIYGLRTVLQIADNLHDEVKAALKENPCES